MNSNEYKEAHKIDDDGVGWVKAKYANEYFNARINKLEKGLKDIIKHQEMVIGDLSKISATVAIAKKALGENE